MTSVNALITVRSLFDLGKLEIFSSFFDWILCSWRTLENNANYAENAVSMLLILSKFVFIANKNHRIYSNKRTPRINKRNLKS